VTRTLEDALAWAADGAAHLRGLMSRLADEAFRAPSTLPGWTRAHVLTHVARNADALGNLLTWARTGEPTPAYASQEQRDADIEAGARRPPATIRADVISASDRLAEMVRTMPGQAWSAAVRNAQGRRILAGDVPWFRAREMWIHSVDLDAGSSFADFPRPMVRELLTDVTAAFAAREDAPDLRLAPTDEERTWSVGEPARAVEVRGPASSVAAWLLGRAKGRDLRTADGSKLPPVPRWL
jgi:maleylpyruvate isomerase